MSLYKKIVVRLNYISGQFVDLIYKLYAKFILKNSEFTIICNNCYGGHLYETINRPYNTPTVGLYFFAEDYIKFIENLEACLDEQLRFIPQSRFEECQKEHQSKKYPIGLLSNNIEIHFLHYKTEEEAIAKWERRKSRLNHDQVLIIMNDQNRFNDELMVRFDAIDYPKVFLSSKHREGDNVKVVSYYKGNECVGDMYNDKYKCLKDFDLVSWVKSKRT